MVSIDEAIKDLEAKIKEFEFKAIGEMKHVYDEASAKLKALVAKLKAGL